MIIAMSLFSTCMSMCFSMSTYIIMQSDANDVQRDACYNNPPNNSNIIRLTIKSDVENFVFRSTTSILVGTILV